MRLPSGTFIPDSPGEAGGGCLGLVGLIFFIWLFAQMCSESKPTVTRDVQRTEAPQTRVPASPVTVSKAKAPVRIKNQHVSQELAFLSFVNNQGLLKDGFNPLVVDEYASRFRKNSIPSINEFNKDKVLRNFYNELKNKMDDISIYAGTYTYVSRTTLPQYDFSKQRFSVQLVKYSEIKICESQQGVIYRKRFMPIHVNFINRDDFSSFSVSPIDAERLVSAVQEESQSRWASVCIRYRIIDTPYNSTGSVTDGNRQLSAWIDHIDIYPVEKIYGEPIWTVSSRRPRQSITQEEYEPVTESYNLFDQSISGRWALSSDQNGARRFAMEATFSLSGQHLKVFGDGWSGDGNFDGSTGAYKWVSTNGDKGNTELTLNRDGTLHLNSFTINGIYNTYVANRLSATPSNQPVASISPTERTINNMCETLNTGTYQLINSSTKYVKLKFNTTSFKEEVVIPPGQQYTMLNMKSGHYSYFVHLSHSNNPYRWLLRGQDALMIDQCEMKTRIVN